MRWVVDTYNEEPPKSALRRGLTYTINQYQALWKFLEDGRLPLDNNDCERELRAVAVGRKNYLFTCAT
jgi:transposase